MPCGWSQSSMFDQQALSKLFTSSPQTTNSLQTLKKDGLSVGNTKCMYFLEMPNESTCFPSKCISALSAPSTKIYSCKESSFSVWSAEGLETIIILVLKPHIPPRRGHSRAVQGLLHSLRYTSPRCSAKPGEALPPCGFVAGGCTALARREAQGAGLPRKRVCISLQRRQGLLQGLCLSRQSDRKKVLRSPPRTHLTLTKENTRN